jgi:hypothetical protein
LGKFAIDPFTTLYNHKNVRIPSQTTNALGSFIPTTGYRLDESGYEFQKNNGEKITVHCAPRPSWDFCLDDAGLNLHNMKSVNLEYYLLPDMSENWPIIVSISQDNKVLISKDYQLKWWKSFSKHYNSHLGKYVAERMDFIYWLLHASVLILYAYSLYNIASYASLRVKNWIWGK